LPRKADVPCASGCGKLLWRSTKSLPPGEMTCQSCRKNRACSFVDCDSHAGSSGICKKHLLEKWATENHGSIRKYHRNYYRQNRMVGVTVNPCTDCSLPTEAVKSNGVRLCEPCADKRRAERDRRKHRARRARKIGAHSEKYSLFEIAERDNYECQYCNCPVDMELSGLLPMGPTIDHRVALSNGGNDLLSNVQLMHRVCNSIKGNR